MSKPRKRKSAVAKDGGDEINIHNLLAKQMGLYPKNATRVHSTRKAILDFDLTPAIAQDWRENKRFPGQRPMSFTHVRELAAKIREGSWHNNYKPIIFDWFDRQLDGQHRAAAVEEAGLPIKVDLIVGADPGIYFHIDEDDKPRRVADYLLKFRHPAKAQAIFRHMMVMTYHVEQREAGEIVGQRWKEPEDDSSDADREAILVWCLQHKAEMDRAVDLISSPSARTVMPGALAAGWYLWARTRWPDEADRFFEALATGDGLKRGEPVYELRQIMTGLRERTRGTGGVKVSSYAWGGILMRGWNAYMEGEPVPKYRLLRQVPTWPLPTTRKTRAR